MRELLLMWRDSRMIVLTMVVTAIYTAFLIPFKGFPVVPGVTEVRLANVFPIVFSVLFGPAAAWGAALGNLLGDVFGGTLTAGSAFGFVGNFFYGFAGYKLWGSLGPLSTDEEPSMRSLRQVVEFVVVALVASAGTAAIIAWGLEVLGLVPFAVLGPIIAVNDFVVAAVLGPPLLYVLYPQVKRDELLYPYLMPEGYLPAVDPSRQRVAAGAIAAVSLGWLAAGTAVSMAATGPEGALVGTTVQGALGVVGFLALFAASVASGERLSALLAVEE